MAVAELAAESRRLRLAFAAAQGAVSFDALAGSGLWRPAALWSLIEEARQDGSIAPDAAAGPGQLRWADASTRTQVVLAATPEDFRALLAVAPFPEIVLGGARAAARERDFVRARALYGAVISAPDRSLLPGGEASWVAAVIESLRLFRSTWAAPSEVLDAALASAEGRGDLRSQAVLLAARGLQALYTEAGRARAMFARATEAAEAVGDAAVRTEVRTYIAVSLVLAGRPREAIAAFEEMLGDVPADMLDGRGAQVDLDGAAPAAAIGLLAFAYACTGDHPRAIDILERVRARGEELGNAALEAQGRVFLALLYSMVGQTDAARPHAEAAHEYWSRGIDISYPWFAALALANVRACDGRLEEAHQLLARALPAWHRTGRPWVGGSRALLLIEELEDAGFPPLDGLTVESEIARYLEAPLPFLSGIVHRVLARRLLAREGLASAERAAAHLDRAIERLREAGARPELRLALGEAADLAQSVGRADDAARLRAAIAELAPASSAGRGNSSDVLRLASVILDLGRLGALAPRRDGLWGEVAARVSREFGAERCAIVESTPEGPALLAVRGAPAWRDSLLERLRREPPAEPVFEPALGRGGLRSTGGQLALVPFADEELGRRGFVAIENRDTAPTVGPGDENLLRALGRQVGILLANVGLWRELIEVRQRLEHENRYYREAAPSAPLGGGRIVGGSPAMREVLELVRRVAPATTPVLVTGETGVGKELVSREVHLLSSRRSGPFIAVHVAALAPGLVASALFGHERGAFTGATEQARGRFELADGGTIFLDEVGELSLDDQVRLLRVLQEGTFERVGGTRVIRSDFRLVAATNRDLAAEVRAGRFREDLYFRLAAFPLRVPPLRERREEIPTLALYFMERTSRKLGVRFEGIGEADMARLVAYEWPGNVRELEHVIERAALLSDPPRLRVPNLDATAVPAAPLRQAAPASPAVAEDWVSLEEVERRYIRKVLHHVRGRVTGTGGAAEVLGLKPSTLQFWIDKLNLRDDLNVARKAKR